MGVTYTVNDSINFTAPFLKFYPVAVNSTNYPALHFANLIAQTILAPPFKWRWNRGTVSFNTINGTQDYSQSVASFGFIENASVQDVNNGNAWKQLTPRLDLALESSTSCPKYVSAQTDDNAGNIGFRLMPVPGAIYPVTIQYQKQAVLFTSLTQTWAPLPDFLFYIYSMGFLALSLVYKSDSMFPWASQQFATRLLAQAEGLSETETNIFLQTWTGITNSVALTALKQTQGNQARLIG